MKRFLKRVAVALGCLLLLCGAAFGLFWVAAMSAPWSLCYEYDGEFAELPASDRPLEEAIERVEGVISGSAQVVRHPDGRHIRIGFDTGGDMWNRPQLPDLKRLCREHGYKGQVGEFWPIDSTGGVAGAECGSGSVWFRGGWGSMPQGVGTPKDRHDPGHAAPATLAAELKLSHHPACPGS